MRAAKIAFVVVCLLVVSGLTQATDAPLLVSYQGVLRNAADKPPKGFRSGGVERPNPAPCP